MSLRPLIRSPWTAAGFSLTVCAVAWLDRDELTPAMKTVFTIFLVLSVPYVVDGFRKPRV
jgi:hypothetical protein